MFQEEGQTPALSKTEGADHSPRQKFRLLLVVGCLLQSSRQKDDLPIQAIALVTWFGGSWSRNEEEWRRQPLASPGCVERGGGRREEAVLS